MRLVSGRQIALALGLALATLALTLIPFALLSLATPSRVSSRVNVLLRTITGASIPTKTPYESTSRSVSTAVAKAPVTPTPTSAPAKDCTMYVSPQGSATNEGKSRSNPLTLVEAAQHSEPGDVVCLLAGIYAVSTPFELTNSGTPSRWIVYKSYDNKAIITPQTGANALMQIEARVRYIEIRGLAFRGANRAGNGILCKGGDHIRIIGNTFRSFGKAGIATFPAEDGKKCDYITVDHNTIYHSGYNQGWSSGISFNSHSWYDRYQGFHSFITNNLIAGEFDSSDHHSDGNGIIMDNPDGGGTPPVLIANNIVYQNGGRCFNALHGSNYWVVNNTCYKNGLDLTLQNGSDGNAGELTFYGSANNYVINNIAVSWGDRRPYSDEDGTPAQYYHNLWSSPGTGTNYVPGTVEEDPNQLREGDPLFVNPPFVDPGAGSQYAHAVDPTKITDEFRLQGTSAAIGAGIDPTTISGIPPDIITGLKTFIYKDIEGNARPQEGPLTLERTSTLLHN